MLHKIDGSWEKTELETSGGADWAGIEISNQGMMWAYVYYPNTGSSLSLYKQEGMTSPGLGSDVDGDGWSRVDELRCGTDYANSSSTPADSDGDGECDLYDGWEDTSISGESDSLSLGEAFGCVVLSNSSVACWGDNSEGQLDDEAGAYSDHAVTVDLPRDSRREESRQGRPTPAPRAWMGPSSAGGGTRRASWVAGLHHHREPPLMPRCPPG